MANDPITRRAHGKITPKRVDGMVVTKRKQYARDIRKGVEPLKNEGGGYSTHVMSTGGTASKKYKYEANPTVFPNNNGKTWTDLRDDPNAAYKEAKSRGEVIGFKSAKKAEKFGYGLPWKEGAVKKEARKSYREAKKNKELYTQSKEFKAEKKANRKK